MAKRLGYEPALSNSIGTVDAIQTLHYPLKPLEVAQPDKPLNIVWLVAESLRADMLNERVMPATYSFAQRSYWFKNHYSGGNGTRMGIFSMFYGLPANYWFLMLEQRREPVLMEVLRNEGYDFGLFTSAEFTYPEFDSTVFASVDRQKLHEYDKGFGWERDRHNTDSAIDFLRQRDKKKPFIVFFFYESPHARYYFPEESVISRPYMEEFNYATADFKNDAPLIKNRYENAVHHLDSQIARLLTFLEQENLMESTIVIITGDHGEEFMENGHWGHNSAYTDEQVRVPMVLHVPGNAPEQFTRMTSHYDVPATLLPFFGLKNSEQDYCLGFNLLGGKERDHVLAGNWSNIAYINSRYKAVMPFRHEGMFQSEVLTSDNNPLANQRIFYEQYGQQLTDLLLAMSVFSRHQ
jgi:membrane-anchored protein YejM (alkaline phosphatase superfamily)